MDERENVETSVNNDENSYSNHIDGNHKEDEKEFEIKEESLYDAVSGLLMPIFFPDGSNASSSFFHRAKASFSQNLPRVCDASRNSGSNLLQWARSGSSLRLLLFISVGTITLLTLTGILVFLLFLAAATTNAVVLSLFVSLAAAGGCLAIFFACVAAIYIGALSVAVFVISSVTVSAIIAVLITTGWIGFFWILWTATRKSFGIAKHSASFTGSALSAYTTAWQVKRHHYNHHD
ncbi:hypothetical protein RND81_03G182900 [Saponaria officinalis]|uniref:Uncharacterized protein n=1 Tax=Saponaria officinalis TaxID=3572 RepID=A0AAW1M963_SAPOF